MEITKHETFEDRLKAKIRDDIGTLITDDELSKIIARSLDELFFRARPNPEWERLEGWQRQHEKTIPRQLPCLAHEMTLDLLKPMVKQAVDNWVLANHEKITAQLKTTLEDQLPLAIMSGFTSIFTGIAMPAVQKLQDQMRDLSMKGMVQS